MNNDKGFTLIEIIAVLAIISIIGAVGFLKFDHMTASAEMVKAENILAEANTRASMAWQRAKIEFVYIDDPSMFSLEDYIGIPGRFELAGGVVKVKKEFSIHRIPSTPTSPARWELR